MVEDKRETVPGKLKWNRWSHVKLGGMSTLTARLNSLTLSVRYTLNELQIKTPNK